MHAAFALLLLAAATPASPFTNVFNAIAAWCNELAMPVTVIGLVLSGIFMALHHRAARDMLVGTIVGAVILFGAPRRAASRCHARSHGSTGDARDDTGGDDPRPRRRAG